MAGPGRGRLRSYVKLPTDHLFDEDFLDLPDPALAAFLVAWSWAARQPERGFFRTDRVLREYLGPRRSRAVSKLYAEGLLYRLSDRRVEVVGYAEMHEGDASADDRNASARARRKTVREALESVGATNTAPAPSPETNGPGEGSTNNRNERHALPDTQDPEPSTPSSSIDLGVVLSAHEAATNGTNPPDAEGPEPNPHRGPEPLPSFDKAGAIQWLTWLWRKAPSDDQLERLSEVAEEAQRDPRRPPGWEWLMERGLRTWLRNPSVRVAHPDPVDYVFAVNKRWRQQDKPMKESLA